MLKSGAESQRSDGRKKKKNVDFLFSIVPRFFSSPPLSLTTSLSPPLFFGPLDLNVTCSKNNNNNNNNDTQVLDLLPLLPRRRHPALRPRAAL